MIQQYKYGEELRKEYIAKIIELRNAVQLNQDIGIAEEIAGDYSGREILEFVQNMADAANKSGKDCCGLIKLVGSNIIICNQGKPFDKKGILSIHQAYNSPKKHEEISIGNKGLGFRGVLNLADSVEIYSGVFAMKFSKQIAKNELEKIKNEPQIQKTIQEYGDKTYIPMFATPIDVDFPENMTKDGKYKIDNIEYDTFIKIHIEDDEKTKKFIDQIIDFINTDSNSLLFLNHLKSLTFSYPDAALRDVVTTVTAKETETISTKPDIKLYVLSKSDTETNESYYVCTKNNLTIAVPRTILNDRYVPYVYFPVKKENDSFSVILHAKDFKITSNRNAFEDQNKDNLNIAKDLFDFLLEISCFFAQQKYDDLSLKIVTFLTALDSPFKEHEDYFYEKLYDLPIIPTITSVYKSINDGIKRYPDEFVEYVNLFNNNNNIISKDIFDKIPTVLQNKVQSLSPAEMYAQINEISENIDSDTRAKLFFDWKKFTKEKCDNLMPKILKYTNGEFFTYNTLEHDKISIVATDKEIKHIPNWAKNPILCEEDRKSLYNNIGKLNPAYITEQNKDRKIEDNFKKDFTGPKDINTFLDDFMNTLINNDYEKAKDFVIFLIQNRDIADSLNKNQTKLNLPDNYGNVYSADNLYFGASYNQHNENICNLFEMKEFISFDKIKPYIDANITPEDVVNLFNRYYFVNKTPTQIIHGDINNTLINDGYDKYIEDKMVVYGDNDWYITKTNMDFIKNLKLALNNVKTKEDTESILSWINNEKSIYHHITHNDTIQVYYRYNRAKSDNSETLYDVDNYDKYLLYTTKWLVLDDGQKYAPYELLLKNDIKGIIKAAVDIFGETYKKLFTDIGVKENIYETEPDVFYKAMLLLPTIDKEGIISRRIYNSFSGEDKYKKYAPVSILSCPEKKRFFEQGKLFAKQSEKDKGEFRPLSEVKFASHKTLNLNNQWIIDKNIRTGNAKEFKSIFNIDEIQDKINITKTTTHPSQCDFNKMWDDFKPFIKIYAERNQNIQNNYQNLKITIVSSAENDNQQITKDIPDYFVLPGKNNTEWYIYLPENERSLDREKLGENLGEIFNMIANTGNSIRTEINLLFISTDRLTKLSDMGYDITSYKNSESIKDSFIDAIKVFVPDFDSDSLDIDIFNNIESFNSKKQIMDILTTNNLTFKEIKNSGFLSDIDFSTCHNEIIKTKLPSRKQYERQLYNDVKNKSDYDKKLFFDDVDQFDKNIQNISVNESDIKCDYDKYYQDLYPYHNHPQISESEININSIFSKNKEQFMEKNKDFSDDDMDGLNNEEKSMLLFELFEDLKTCIENRINNKKQKNTEQNTQTQQNNYKIIISDGVAAKIPHQSSGEHDKHNARKESGEKMAKEKAKKGEEAETIVYNTLDNNKKDYTELDWVSHIGYKKGKGQRDDDSLGYDISYKSVAENKTYYAEVKSVSKNGNQYEFFVSENEKTFAEKHPNSFVFALVLPNDEIQIIKDSALINNIFAKAAQEKTYKCAIGVSGKEEQ